MDFVSTLAASVVGGLIGASGGLAGATRISNAANKRQIFQNKLDLTLKLYEEFESEPWNENRTKARDKLRDLRRDIPDLTYQKLEKEHKNDFPDIHKLFHFYERIAVLYLGGYLDASIFDQTLKVHYIAFYKDDMQSFIDISFGDAEHEKENVHWVKSVERLGEQLLAEKAS